MVMVNNQGDADFLCFMKVNWSHNYANEISSHVWNIFKLKEFIDISQKIICTKVITSCGGNNIVMVNNQGDADFLCFMRKVHWCLHYANVKSSHVLIIL